MYNLEFDQAHQDFSTWERLHPDDPLGPVSQAAGYLFAEFARLGILESQLFTNDKTFECRTKLAPDPKVRERVQQRRRAAVTSWLMQRSSNIPKTATLCLPRSWLWACARITSP